MPHIILHLTNEEFELCNSEEPGTVGLWIDDDCLTTWKTTELGDTVPLWLVHRAFMDVFNAGKKARSEEIKKLLGAK